MTVGRTYPQFRALLLGKTRSNGIPRDYYREYSLFRLFYAPIVIALIPHKWGFWIGLLTAVAIYFTTDFAIRYAFSLSNRFWWVWHCLPRPYPLKRMRLLARWKGLPLKVSAEAMALLESIASRLDQIRNVTTEAIGSRPSCGPAMAAQIEMWLRAEKLVGKALDIVLSSRRDPEGFNVAALRSIDDQIHAIETDSLLNLGRNIRPLLPIATEAKAL